MVTVLRENTADLILTSLYNRKDHLIKFLTQSEELSGARLLCFYHVEERCL